MLASRLFTALSDWPRGLALMVTGCLMISAAAASADELEQVREQVPQIAVCGEAQFVDNPSDQPGPRPVIAAPQPGEDAEPELKDQADQAGPADQARQGPPLIPVEKIAPKKPDQPEPDAQANAEDPDDELELNIRVTSISIDRRLSFDNDGQVRHRSNRLSLSLYCQIAGDATPTTYQVIDVEPIVTSGGQVHKPAVSNRTNMLNRHGRANQNRAFSISMSVNDFGLAKGKIKQVAGTLRFEVPTGDKHRARLGPFEDFNNKQVHLEGRQDDWLRVRRDGARTYIAINRDLSNRVASIKCVDAKGKTIASDGYSVSWSNQRVERRYNLRIPNDASVVVEFYNRLERRDVPFVLEDIPLPATEKRDVFDMAGGDFHDHHNAPAIARR